MIYLKGIIAGVVAFIIFFIAFPLISIPLMSYLKRDELENSGATIGWDPVAFAHSPGAGLMLLGVFTAGFLWQLRRSRRPEKT